MGRCDDVGFCCNVLEVDDLISQLTRGKYSIYTSSI
jgi:hypothetical protein